MRGVQVPQDSVHADSNSLVHGLLNANDLMERRVDLWINNFPGATHLVDVYSGRRVDKRKAFPSQYTRLQHLQELQTSSAADFTVRPPLVRLPCLRAGRPCGTHHVLDS